LAAEQNAAEHGQTTSQEALPELQAALDALPPSHAQSSNPPNTAKRLQVLRLSAAHQRVGGEQGALKPGRVR